MTFYLYVKTHNKTNKKYLGKTTKDPHRYHGSGIDWIEHLKEHGKDVTTEVIFECESISEFREMGEYYSDLWNIVESSEWLNRIPERGSGGSGVKGSVHYLKVPEDKRKEYAARGGKVGGKVCFIEKKGIFSRTKEEMIEFGKKEGYKGGRASFEKKKGFFNEFHSSKAQRKIYAIMGGKESRGKIWVTHITTKQTKRIKPEESERFLSTGWKLGREKHYGPKGK